MSRSILLCVILSTLSIAALGQTITLSTECMNAANSFYQERACFGSDEARNYFLSTPGSISSFMNSSMQGFDNPNLQQAIRTFYNNFCTSQYCVNLYADATDICLRAIPTLNETVALLVDQIVDYACATNENGEYCILAQMDNLNDFNTVYLCSLGLNTLPSATGVSCDNTCDAVRRTRTSTGCCINTQFELIKRFFSISSTSADVSFPDTSGVFTDCGVTDPGMCTTTLNNPLTSSGDHRLVHSWWLLAAVLVSVKVIMG